MKRHWDPQHPVTSIRGVILIFQLSGIPEKPLKLLT